MSRGSPAVRRGLPSSASSRARRTRDRLDMQSIEHRRVPMTASRALVRALCLVASVLGALAGCLTHAAEAGGKSAKAPQAVVISLDGARADVVRAYLASGVLDRNVGLGRLAQH